MNILNYGKIQCKFCAHNICFPPLRKFFPQTCGSHVLFFSQVSKSPHLLRLLSFSSKLFGLTNQGFLFLFAFDVLCCFFWFKNIKNIIFSCLSRSLTYFINIFFRWILGKISKPTEYNMFRSSFFREFKQEKVN